MNLTKIEIDSGSGFVEFKPNYSNFELTRHRENNVRIRFKSSGNLRFVGSEFDTLDTLRKSGTISLDIKFYINYALACEGKLNLFSQNWEIEKKVCGLSVNIVDRYTDILKKYDIEKNIFAEASVNSAKIRIDSSLHQIALPSVLTSVNWATAITMYNPDGTTPYDPDSSDDWDIITDSGGDYSTLTNASILSITDAGSGKINVESTDHGLIDSQYNLPNLTIYNTTDYNAVYNDVIVIDDDNFTVTATFVSDETGDWKVAEAGYHVFTFKCQYVDFPADGYELGTYLTNWYLKTGFTTSEAELEFETWRIIYDIIEDLLNLTDSSINITQTAGSNDYCKYFDITDTDYNKLMIDLKCNIKTPDNYKTNAQFTLKRLLEVYKILFNLDWKINDNDYFQFIHPSENSLSLPSFATFPKHDFTANNKALLLNRFQYTVDNFINSEIWNTEKLNNSFFDGYPIFYNNESDNKIEYALAEFYNDLKELTLNNDNISDEGYCIIATFIDSSENIIYNVNDEINGKLGIYDLQKNILANGDRYFDEGEINNIDEPFTNIKNSKFVELMQPLNDFDDLDFNYLVKTEVTDNEGITGARIESVKQKFDGSFAKINLSF